MSLRGVVMSLEEKCARLQESLTACERELVGAKKTLEVVTGIAEERERESRDALHEVVIGLNAANAADKKRVAVLERALRTARAWVFAVPNQPEFLVRDVLKQIDVALNPVPPAETPAPTIIGRTVISEPGAALTVTELHLSEETKRALSTNGVRIPSVARDASVDAPETDNVEEAMRLSAIHGSARVVRDGKLRMTLSRQTQALDDVDRLRADLEKAVSSNAIMAQQLAEAMAETAAERKQADELQLLYTRALEQADAHGKDDDRKLDAANEEIARLRDERDEARDHEMSGKENHATTTAKLGAAVDMLQRLLAESVRITNNNRLDDCEKIVALCHEARVVAYADAESKAASEALADGQRFEELARAVAKSARLSFSQDGHRKVSGEVMIDLNVFISTVDARRGGGR